MIMTTTTKRNQAICYFDLTTAPECDPVNGECPNDWPMNEDGNCHPGGECPDGFGRVDDDETGTCYDEDDIVDCDNGAKVLTKTTVLLTIQIHQEIQDKSATLNQTTNYAILTTMVNVLKAWASMTMANVSHRVHVQTVMRDSTTMRQADAMLKVRLKYVPPIISECFKARHVQHYQQKQKQNQNVKRVLS